MKPGLPSGTSRDINNDNKSDISRDSKITGQKSNVKDKNMSQSVFIKQSI